MIDDLSDWCRWLNQVHEINLTVCYDPFERVRFIDGLGTTIVLSVLALAGSMVIGVVGAYLSAVRPRLVRGAIAAMVHAFRNTPPLIQLYFFYFAVGALLPGVSDGNGMTHPVLDGFAWAVLAFSLLGGAFTIENLRAGIEAIPRHTIEAAIAVGHPRWQIYWLIQLPLALRISLPALTNTWVNLVKTTTLASAIGVGELLYVSSQVWSDDMNVREMMALLLVSYALIVGVLVLILAGVERLWRLPGGSLQR